MADPAPMLRSLHPKSRTHACHSLSGANQLPLDDLLALRRHLATSKLITDLVRKPAAFAGPSRLLPASLLLIAPPQRLPSRTRPSVRRLDRAMAVAQVAPVISVVPSSTCPNGLPRIESRLVASGRGSDPKRSRSSYLFVRVLRSLERFSKWLRCSSSDRGSLSPISAGSPK
jgi:hypothetical protein